MLIWLFFVHWFADDFCQTRWMAENKGESMWPLTAHVAAYSFLFICGLCLPGSIQIDNVVAMAFWNCTSHWIIDIVLSKATIYYKEQRNAHAFYSIVGLDYFFHYSILVITYQMFLNK